MVRTTPSAIAGIAAALLAVMAHIASPGLIELATARQTGAARELGEEELTFRAGEMTLSGTVIFPAAGGPHPAVVLVHGSGPARRDGLRREAEAFARGGVAALIYDKRTVGYSASGVGERSYDLLASDALAAVAALRTHRLVDPDAVGLWGLSEGGWVAPLAANRSRQIAFVVLVGSSGVPPAQQVGWALITRMRQQGISGSMLEAIGHTGLRVLASVGGMAEARRDPTVPLEQLRQPVLAIWGEHDRTAPPAESAEITQQALERGGNQSYTIHFFPDAQHGLEQSLDGFTRSDLLAEGYVETVADWIHQVALGEPPAANSDELPAQSFRSRPLAPLAWWESTNVQIAMAVLPFLAFVSYPMIALISTAVRIWRTKSLANWPRARPELLGLSLAGSLAIVGFVVYASFVMLTGARELGPLLAGRPLPWLALQLLAIATSVFTVRLAASWWHTRGARPRLEQFRKGTLLAGGVLFVPWAAYWSLLSL